MFDITFLYREQIETLQIKFFFKDVVANECKILSLQAIYKARSSILI